MADKNILIVDDEELVLHVLERLFSSSGYTVLCAADGESALRLMKEHHIRVIFTDLRMDGMDGVALCRRAKEMDAESIVYAMSGYLSAYSPEQLKEAGFEGQFNKPFDTGALLEACKEAFAQLEPNKESVQSHRNRRHLTRGVVLEEYILISIVGSQRDASLAGKTLTCVESTVSQSAILLCADQEIEPGTDLMLHVGVMGQLKPCLLDGIVRWCQPSEGEETAADATEEASFSVGVEILDSSRDLDSWCAFLHELHLKRRIST